MKGTGETMINVDACGLSCPEPLMMLKKALDKLDDKSANEILLLVDNKTALENCTRLAKRKGCTVDVKSRDDIYEMQIKRG